MSPRTKSAGSDSRKPWSGERLTILLSLALGILCWLADAVVDSIFFTGLSFLESAFTSVPPHELYVRSSAMALLLSFGLVMAQVISRRKRREAQLLVLQRMRDAVWQMSGPDDIRHVVEALGHGLETLAIPVHGYALNLVTCEEPLRVVYYEATTHDRAVAVSENPQGHEIVLRMWRQGDTAHRPDLGSSDPAGERDNIEHHFGDGVRSVLDVPFSHGTLAVNSREPDAFSADHIHVIEAMAKVVSGGYRRMADLRGLVQGNAELREKDRLLDAFHEIGNAALGSLDLDEMLDHLAQYIIRAGIFRSLMVALVDAEREHVEVVRSFVCAFGDDGLRVPGAAITSYPDVVGFRYALDDDNITAQVARTGEMAVIDGSDERFDSRREPTSPNSVSYFIPVKRGDQTLAILATGSSPQDRDEILARINTMQPLLDQVAIALEHARLYGSLQHEIAERKRAEQEVIHLERMRASGELAAGVSHNLNNMLTTVLGPAQFLLRKSDDPEIRREAQAILTAGRRARDLVARLNQAVRADQGDPLGPVSVNGQVREVVRMARPRWQDEPESRGVRVEVVTELAETPDIRGNPSELSDAILNLLLNAVEALPEGGIITIATQAVAAGAQLLVRDTGVGMDGETRRRVFEPFFTTKMDVGSGLGLSTVHGIVTRWGGTIEADSTPGQGTTFTLCFPTWNRGAAPTEAPPAPVTDPRPGSLLIVENDEDVCRLLDHLLSVTHTVTVVRNGEEALDRFEPGRYDAALIDLGMPGMAGDKVAAQMMRVDSSLATVLITGWPLGDADPRRSAFDFHIPKPFDDLGHLESIVAQAMELHHARAGAGARQE